MRPRWGSIRTVHFVGVGGVGMCGLATVLAAEGCEVSGCDATASARTEALRKSGLTVEVGHAPDHVVGQDLVVVTAAIAPDHPELLAARERGVAVIRRADLLAEVMRGRLGLAVAGTHGKTTTSAMAAHILLAAGEDPTAVVGGAVASIGGYGRSGAGPVMVCEADEFDRAFLSLDPLIAVVTNVEPEHLECYGSESALRGAFAEFTSRVPRQGRVIICGDDPGAAELAGHARAPVTRFGFGEGNDLRAADWRPTGDGSQFRACWRGVGDVDVALSVPGRHNASNALGAVAAAVDAGVGLDVAASALTGFSGVQRRLQRLGECRGVVVVDDYAHHPTEVSAAIAAARSAHAGRRLVAVFQPHLYSRTETFARAFGRALAAADVAAVLPVFAAREAPRPGVDHQLVISAVAEAGGRGENLPNLDGAVDRLKVILEPGDVLLTLGAGDVDRVARGWLELGDGR